MRLKDFFAKLLLPEASGTFQLPLGAYYLSRILNACKPLMMIMSRIESWWTKRSLKETKIDRPIYIMGMARAGTTITLEILHRHLYVATHRYFHMALPFLPYLLSWIMTKIPLPQDLAVERIHRDSLKVNVNSPEAVEEALWEAFFDWLHDENRSSVLDENTSNKAFERFYQDHLRKLLVYQQKARYATKNNYNSTRMAYILHLFPDAKFLLIVRRPVEHIASFIKQNHIFHNIGKNDPKMNRMIEQVGHHEFGDFLALINPNNGDMVRKIRVLFSEGKDVQAWATYWAAVYGFLAAQLKENTKLAKATLVVRYDDLCGNPRETIAKILEHTQLSMENFSEVLEEYVGNLKKPTYYNPDFTEQDLYVIESITREVAEKFGCS